MTPTARTLQAARALGYTAQVVERFNRFAKVRQDLFGCIDLILAGHGSIIGVQATTGAHHADRKAKALAEPRLRVWLECGGRFEVWSWSQKGERGKRKTWQLRREELTGRDVAEWVGAAA